MCISVIFSKCLLNFNEVLEDVEKKLNSSNYILILIAWCNNENDGEKNTNSNSFVRNVI